MNEPVEVVILAGGAGTRLRPFTISIPKPLLPVSDLPIVEIALRQLQSQGFRNVCFSLGYLAPLIQNFFGNGSRLGLNITYVIEDEPLGTAGALALIPSLSENFLVQNGDTLTDVDYESFMNFHRTRTADASVFVYEIEETVDYGVVEVDESSLLKSYQEKPIRKYSVSTGVYILTKSVLQLLESRRRFDMPQLLDRARTRGKTIACYLQSGAYWKDIGRFDHYEQATRDFEADRARFLPYG